MKTYTRISILYPGQHYEAVLVEQTVKIEDQVQMSKVEIPIDQTKRLPAIGGEVDLQKCFNLCLGFNQEMKVQAVYMLERSPDQNLMLLDGVPLLMLAFIWVSLYDVDAVKI